MHMKGSKATIFATYRAEKIAFRLDEGNYIKVESAQSLSPCERVLGANSNHKSGSRQLRRIAFSETFASGSL